MSAVSYIICDGHGNALGDGIQSRIVADRAAQAHADRIGQTVYLSGPDCDDEPVEPQRARPLDLGYATVSIFEDRTDPANPGWAFRATFANGREASGEVDCDAGASPGEAVSAWLEEHVGYGGRGPVMVTSTPEGARVLRW